MATTPLWALNCRLVWRFLSDFCLSSRARMRRSLFSVVRELPCRCTSCGRLHNDSGEHFLQVTGGGPFRGRVLLVPNMVSLNRIGLNRSSPSCMGCDSWPSSMLELRLAGVHPNRSSTGIHWQTGGMVDRSQSLIRGEYSR